MTKYLGPSPKWREVDASGNPLAGGKVYTYASGTTTPLATYSDINGTTANANPVLLNVDGEATIYFTDTLYKIVVKNSADVTQYTLDPYDPTSAVLSETLRTDLADTTTATKGAGAVAYNPALSYPAGSVGAELQAAAPSSSVTYADAQAETYQTFTADGTAPAYTLTPTPSVSSLTTQSFMVTFAADGTTGSNTLNVSGLGAVALKQYDSSGALVSGVIKNGFIAKIKYNGTYWVILNPLPSASTSTGRLLGVTYYAAGTSAYVKGTNSPTFVIVEGVAGGGSGASTSGAAKANLATGGAAGGFFRKKILASALAASETVTVGTGGAAVTNSFGNDGGTTSFGSHCSATGGKGGVKDSSASAISITGAAGGTATGGDLNIAGGGSSGAASPATTTVIGLATAGGNSYFGGGGPGNGGASADGGAPGAGGGAYAATSGSTSSASGKGADGIVIVYEYS